MSTKSRVTALETETDPENHIGFTLLTINEPEPGLYDIKTGVPGETLRTAVPKKDLDNVIETITAERSKPGYTNMVIFIRRVSSNSRAAVVV